MKLRKKRRHLSLLLITKSESGHIRIHRQADFQRGLLSEFYTLFTLMSDYVDRVAFWKNHLLRPHEFICDLLLWIKTKTL